MNVNFWVGYTPEYPQVNKKCKKSIERFGFKCYDVPHYYVKGTTNPFIRTRFLVPYIDYDENNQWVFFCDDDFLFLKSPQELLDNIELDDTKKVYVCKHPEYTSKVNVKMDGKIQRSYPRKNWSSLMLFNKKRYNLQLKEIMFKPLSYILGFEWTMPGEIGEIPLEWNWLVGEYDDNDEAKALHYTLGGPWYNNPYPSKYNKLWNNFI